MSTDEPAPSRYMKPSRWQDVANPDVVELPDPPAALPLAEGERRPVPVDVEPDEDR